jgi:hypothetical protein
MKSVISRLRAASLSTLLVGTLAFTSHASAATETLNFNNNQLPIGWTLGFIQGQNATFSNGRFEVGQVDTQAFISRLAPELQSAAGLTIQFNTNIANNYWGMGSAVELFSPSGVLAAGAGTGKVGYGIQHMSLYMYSGNGLSQPSLPFYTDQLPLVSGTYSLSASFRDGAISEEISQIGGNNHYSTGWINTPGFTLASVSRINLHATTTSGESAWIDNVSITVTPVPEPESYAMLLIGLAVVSGIAYKRRAGPSYW